MASTSTSRLRRGDRRPHILVVDDEEAIRDLIENTLGEAGLVVDAAEDGASALASLERAPVDLAIVDIRLPGEFDGVETVRRARERNPQMRALFISGIEIEPRLTDRERDDFIAKPFRARELLGCVFEILHRDVGGKTPDWL